jgi:hypothetical protein
MIVGEQFIMIFTNHKIYLLMIFQIILRSMGIIMHHIPQN